MYSGAADLRDRSVCMQVLVTSEIALFVGDGDLRDHSVCMQVPITSEIALYVCRC